MSIQNSPRDYSNRLENMKNVARVLHLTLGNRCEVAVHDFRDLEHSMVHIEGNITNRPIGAPVTDLVVKALRKEGDGVRDILNYSTTTRDGRALKSSTCFVRDRGGKVIGALCINLETTDMINAISMMQEMTSIRPGEDCQEPQDETFAHTVHETNESLMDDAMRKIGKHPGTMNRDERIRLVSVLDDYGAFLIKGMVDYVAERLGVSKFTIYNYLKAARADAGK
ncbi:helix-turn-helix transcriptional regulator [Desulfocurvus sp. DL9XJH121]